MNFYGWFNGKRSVEVVWAVTPVKGAEKAGRVSEQERLFAQRGRLPAKLPAEGGRLRVLRQRAQGPLPPAHAVPSPEFVAYIRVHT